MNRQRPPIYFVRHGETDWNVQGLIQGWTDTPLNQKGHAQARAVARAIAAIPRIGADYAFMVSPLQRARQTMGYIAEALALDATQVMTEAAVKEMSFGVWEGRPFREMRTSPAYPAHPDERYSWRPEQGESYADGHARITRWLDGLDRPAVVVAHGAIGRCLIAEITGMPGRDLVDLTMHQGFYCRLAEGRAEWFDATAEAA